MKSKPTDYLPLENSSSVKTPLSRCTSLLALIFVFYSAAAHAEVTTDSYTCTLDSETRSVSLTFINARDTLPCEIREVKNNNRAKPLWRAENDLGFCKRQFKAFRQKQELNGWNCESMLQAGVGTDDPGPPAAASPPETGPETGLETGPETGSRFTAVNKDTDLEVKQLTPTPPKGRFGNLTPEDIRDMDDWLIYLSAQTMSSIRALVLDDDTFAAYQKREALNANNIYERLQSRINFLNTLTTGPGTSFDTASIQSQ